MDPFAFVRLVVYGLHCVYLGVRRRHASVSPPTVDLRRKRRRLCETDSRQPEQPGPEKTLGVLLEEYCLALNRASTKSTFQTKTVFS